MDENKEFENIKEEIEEEIDSIESNAESKFNDFAKTAGEKMSEFAKGTAKITKDFSSLVGEKAQKVVDTTRRTIEAEKLEYIIAKKYKEMGKRIYAAYDKGEGYEHLVDDECEEITELFDQIIAIRTGDLMSNANECEEEKTE